MAGTTDRASVGGCASVGAPSLRMLCGLRRLSIFPHVNRCGELGGIAEVEAIVSVSANGGAEWAPGSAVFTFTPPVYGALHPDFGPVSGGTPVVVGGAFPGGECWGESRSRGKKRGRTKRERERAPSFVLHLCQARLPTSAPCR